MQARYTTPLGPFAPDIGAAFNTFTTKQDVSPLPLPILPANAVDKGTILKIEAEGEFSTTATPTLVLGFYAGAPGASGGGTITHTLAESSAITTGSGAASWPWRLEYRGKFTLTGSSGTIVGCGDIEFGTSLTALTSFPIPITLALRTVTFNTTIANAIGVCATYSASSISNAVRTYAITASLLN
jgi:hypothetical protein